MGRAAIAKHGFAVRLSWGYDPGSAGNRLHRGIFVYRTIRPGEYRVAAVLDFEQGAWNTRTRERGLNGANSRYA
jgi:hypothetical protein